MPLSDQYGRVAAAVIQASVVSACASNPPISAQQESSNYRSMARGSYAPPGPPNDPWGPYITEAAAKFDVPDRWIREVMRQESGGHLFGRGGQLITSGAGAMGLMQVMPATYDEIRGRYPELGDDPFDPHNNILAGTAYIREMYDIYGSPGFLAAYNAGPGRMDDYLTRSRTLPDETRRYVANISARLSGQPNRPSPGEQYAMNAAPLQITAGSRYSAPPVQFARAEPSPSSSGGARIVLGQPTPVVVAPVEIAAPTQFAAASLPAEPSNRIRLTPQPVESASEPVQMASVAPPGFTSYTPSAYAPPPALEPRATLGQSASLPEPPRPVPAPPVPASAQSQQFAALQSPGTSRRLGFQFVASANAAPVRHASMPGGWAVQVGAFANPNLAAAANAAARDQVRDVLGGAQPLVATVRASNSTLYRARLTGLSHDAAAHACERLARSRTNCMVVSPDAQS